MNQQSLPVFMGEITISDEVIPGICKLKDLFRPDAVFCEVAEVIITTSGHLQRLFTEWSRNILCEFVAKVHLAISSYLVVKQLRQD